MRLARLDLTRFGRFDGASIAFAPPAPGAPDLHIVYGANEAGKSTAFAAWLDLLYGIPVQTPYAFLHSYDTMRIGALLQQDGREVALTRIKRLKGSLLDAGGSPLPEAMIGGLTGGIDRAGYAAMFSLDDATLEAGGEDILRSEGNLGEMLFSASAGLAGLAQRLAEQRAAADAFHRPGTRKHGLADAKAGLDALAERRRSLDIDATRYRALRAEVEAAEAAHATTGAAQAQAVAALDAVQRALNALPLLARLAGTEAALAELPDLPAPPSGWAAEMAALDRRAAEARAKTEDADERAEALRRLRDAQTPDPVTLDLAGALAAAAALRSGHDEAVKDLPRRREEADALAADLAIATRALGQPDRPARDLLLPPARIAALREALAERTAAGLDLSAKREEAEAAEATLREALAALPEGAVEHGDTEALALLIDRLRARDPGQALRVAEEQAVRAAAVLDARMAALLPFQGDAVALARQLPPSAGALAALSARIAAAATGLAAARTEARRCAAEVTRLESGIALRGAGAGEAQAADLRAQREALWAAHRRDLTAASADAFEAAMRRDDLAMAALAERQTEAALRRSEAEALARARAETLAADAAAVDATAMLDAAEAELSAIRSALSPDLPADMDTAALRDWLGRRAEALAAAADHHRAEDAADRARDDLALACTALVGLLGKADLPYDGLMALAEARSRAAARTAALRQSAAKATAERDRRQAALDLALQRAGNARQIWTSLCDGTWIDPATPPAAAAALLDGITRLDGLVTRQDDLAQRIAKMQANVAAFTEAVAPLAARLRIAEPDPARAWIDLHQQVDAAHKHQSDRQRAEAELAELAGRQTDLAATTTRIAARLAEMAGFFGADDPALLAGLMQAAQTRADLQRARADGLRDLSEMLALPPDQARAAAAAQDREALERDRAALTARSDELRSAAQESYARLAMARSALSSVGGDDAIARLDTERATLLLALRDRAEAHLRQRFGLIALDRALRSYRESHRSTMLARASDGFAAITDGAYSGLSVQPGKSGDALVALPVGGGSKEARHLSKGARMQLYLALRIAGYHEFAATRRAVPFIADDIMETFDDTRAARAFALLADMAHAGQVIYLTHHAHLIDIARTACPATQVQWLDSPGKTV